MTDSIVNKLVVLKLNGLWQPIGMTTPKQAVISLFDNHEESGTLAMNIDYPFNEITQEYDFSNPTAMFPLTWEEWQNVEIRPFDLVIKGSTRDFRAPTVVIAKNFKKMPTKESRPTKSGIYEREGGRCAYSGKKLSKHQATVDHITPKSRFFDIKGTNHGRDSWENLCLADKEINFDKGDSLNEEIGLKLLINPKAPAPQPISNYIKEARHFDWSFFLHK